MNAATYTRSWRRSRRRVLARSAWLGRVLEQALLVQDAAHHRLRHAQPLEAREHVADAPRPVLRVLAPRVRHCVA